MSKGMYRVVAIAKEVGLDVVLPEPDVSGILWVEDHVQDLGVATVRVSRRGAVTGGHGWTPNRQLVHFKGSHKDEQVCELLQRYDQTLKEAI